MKIDALICLLVVMVTVRESLAVEDAVINVETALSPKGKALIYTDGLY